MNTERLYEFLVLSHVLNYTHAAKALYISQPILTRHIQALEAELGVPLFRRTTHGVTLTEAGRLLSNQAEGLLEKCDRALSLVRERNMPVQGSVMIDSLRAGNILRGADSGVYGALFGALSGH